MIKVKTAAWLFLVSIILSCLTILLPQTNGTTIGTFENRQTQTTEFVREIYASGFPLKFYIPGSYDYGANFMIQGFLLNTLIIFVGIVVIYLITNRFRK